MFKNSSKNVEESKENRRKDQYWSKIRHDITLPYYYLEKAPRLHLWDDA